MGKKIFLFLGIIAFIYLIIVFKDYSSKIDAGAQYQQEIINQLIPETKETVSSSTNSGTTTNFQNPSIMIHAVEWLGKSYTGSFDLTGKGGGKLELLGSQMLFDPDHPDWGLPDIVVSTSHIIKDGINEKPFLSGLFFGRNKDEPYRTYKLTLTNGSVLEMKLYITVFNILIDTSFQSNPQERSREELTYEYPSIYYYPAAASNSRTPLRNIRNEFKNQRYYNLNIVFKIKLNNNMTYVEGFTPSGNKLTNKKPRMAVGALICSEIESSNGLNENRMGVAKGLLRKGSAITFFQKYECNKNESNFRPDSDIGQLLNNAFDFIKQSFSSGSDENKSIFQDEQYFKIPLDQIGTWKSGIINQNKRHDYLYATFLMPIFVIGNWEIQMPEKIAKWANPEKVIKPFSIFDLFPKFGRGLLGKIFSFFVTMLTLLFVIAIIVPKFPEILSKLIGSIARSIISIFNKH